MIPKFRNDISLEDVLEHSYNGKKRFCRGFMIIHTSSSKNKVHIRLVKFRVNNGKVSKLTRSGK